MDRRRVALATAVLLVAGAVAHHPTASIQVLTHEAGDLQPHRLQAAVDLGLVGVDLLVTWTGHQLR